MKPIFTLLALSLAAVGALPSDPQRIVGGSVTTINQYPSMVALLYTANWSTFRQVCGGSILNNRSILTAAHCPVGDPASRWRIRLGSTFASNGGIVRPVGRIIIHPNYNSGARLNNDIAIMRLSVTVAYNNVIQPTRFAGGSYSVPDNAAVWATGWGATFFGGPSSEQLRHVQVFTINLSQCSRRYATINRAVTANMLCSGRWGVGGRDQCSGDSGGPLYHNRVLVGICSWGQGCASPNFPGVNTRVSRYTSWITSNA